MNKQYEMVKDFQTKMGQPVAGRPTVMGIKRMQERFVYLEEELNEFAVAETVVDQADAMIDLIYLAIGTLVELGVQPEKLFEIVHNANMSKLWEDGKPRTNPETGKIIKPPTFVRPEPLLQKEIERQSTFWIDAVSRYFPEVTKQEIEFILWEKTAYPLGSAATVEQQLKDLKDEIEAKSETK